MEKIGGPERQGRVKDTFAAEMPRQWGKGRVCVQKTEGSAFGYLYCERDYSS